MSVVGVVSSVHIKAVAGIVSEVSVSSWEVRKSLVWLVSPLSDNSGVSNSVMVSSLVRDGIASLVLSSDRSGSSIEDEPLSSVVSLMVVDSESELMSTNVLMPEEGSVSRQSSSDLELSAIWKWLSSPDDSNLIDVPGLVNTIMAVPEDNMSVVSVRSTVNVKTFLSIVSDVSSRSRVPLDSLSVVSGPLSNGGGNSNSETGSLLVSNHKVSS